MRSLEDVVNLADTLLRRLQMPRSPSAAARGVVSQVEPSSARALRVSRENVDPQGKSNASPPRRKALSPAAARGEAQAAANESVDRETPRVAKALADWLETIEEAGRDAANLQATPN